MWTNSLLYYFSTGILSEEYSLSYKMCAFVHSIEWFRDRWFFKALKLNLICPLRYLRAPRKGGCILRQECFITEGDRTFKSQFNAFRFKSLLLPFLTIPKPMYLPCTFPVIPYHKSC